MPFSEISEHVFGIELFRRLCKQCDFFFRYLAILLRMLKQRRSLVILITVILSLTRPYYCVSKVVGLILDCLTELLVDLFVLCFDLALGFDL